MSAAAPPGGGPFVESFAWHTRDPAVPREDAARCAAASEVVRQELERAFLEVDSEGPALGVTGDVFRLAAYASGARLARMGEGGWRVYSCRSCGELGRRYSFHLTAVVPGRGLEAGARVVVRRLRRAWLGYATEWRPGPRAIRAMRDGYEEAWDPKNDALCGARTELPARGAGPAPARPRADADDMEEVVG